MALTSRGKLKFGTPYVEGVPDAALQFTLDDGRPAVARQIPGHDARAAEEAAINENDIEEALALLDLFASRPEPTNAEERHISLALYRTAVVTFMACIGSKKNQIPEKVFSGADAAYLATAREIRDGHIAHNHGALRQAICVGVYDRVGSELELVGATFAGVEWPYPKDVAPLRALMETARLEARRMKETAMGAAVAHLRALPPEAVERLPDPRTRAVGPYKANTSRGQLATGKRGR